MYACDEVPPRSSGLKPVRPSHLATLHVLDTNCPEKGGKVETWPFRSDALKHVCSFVSTKAENKAKTEANAAALANLRTELASAALVDDKMQARNKRGRVLAEVGVMFVAASGGDGPPNDRAKEQSLGRYPLSGPVPSCILSWHDPLGIDWLVSALGRPLLPPPPPPAPPNTNPAQTNPQACARPLVL
eukprot:365381-Chlamydomonas_euryale.AAC.23